MLYRISSSEIIIDVGNAKYCPAPALSPQERMWVMAHHFSICILILERMDATQGSASFSFLQSLY